MALGGRGGEGRTRGLRVGECRCRMAAEPGGGPAVFVGRQAEGAVREESSSERHSELQRRRRRRLRALHPSILPSLLPPSLIPPSIPPSSSRSPCAAPPEPPLPPPSGAFSLCPPPPPFPPAPPPQILFPSALHTSSLFSYPFSSALCRDVGGGPAEPHSPTSIPTTHIWGINPPFMPRTPTGGPGTHSALHGVGSAYCGGPSVPPNSHLATAGRVCLHPHLLPLFTEMQLSPSPPLPRYFPFIMG